MKAVFKEVNLKLAKWSLPWLETVFLASPYSHSRSRFIDQLIISINFKKPQRTPG
jgi:hypothetical protein